MGTAFLLTYDKNFLFARGTSFSFFIHPSSACPLPPKSPTKVEINPTLLFMHIKQQILRKPLKKHNTKRERSIFLLSHRVSLKF